MNEALPYNGTRYTMQRIVFLAFHRHPDFFFLCEIDGREQAIRISQTACATAFESIPGWMETKWLFCEGNAERADRFVYLGDDIEQFVDVTDWDTGPGPDKDYKWVTLKALPVKTPEPFVL